MIERVNFDYVKWKGACKWKLKKFISTETLRNRNVLQVSVRKPFFFEDASDVSTVEKLEQKYVLCPLPVKDAYVVRTGMEITVENRCSVDDGYSGLR